VMETESLDLDKIKLFNIVDMGLSFSAMIRLYEKESKRIIRRNIIKILKKINAADSEDQFEEHHESFCDWGVKTIVLAEKVRNGRVIKERGPASYGQIAKTLDVVLKVVVHYCHWPNQRKSTELCKWLHAAIDNKMMRFLKDDYPDYFPIWPTSVEGVDKSSYKKLQQLVKIFIKEKHRNEILLVNFDDLYWHRLNRQKEWSPIKLDWPKEQAKQLVEGHRTSQSFTRGGPGKSVNFEWWFDADNNSLMIKNEKGRCEKFHLDEIVKILQQILTEFGGDYFPLANNVQKLGNCTETRGLGTVILDFNPVNINHAQAASYLGPVLEEIGYFDWNGKRVFSGD
jgi:hypothetical protein